MVPYAPKWLLIASYAHLGREKEAAEILGKYIKKRKYDEYTVKWVLTYGFPSKFKEPKDIARYRKGLLNAGLPED